MSVDIEELATSLYSAGWDANENGQDYDPRFSTSWQMVVDHVRELEKTLDEFVPVGGES